MATQAGGGCDGLSNRFVSGFWFIHALAQAGEFNIARVTRQDLAGWSFTSGVSHYTLAGPPGWNNSPANGLPTPHPDWFTAVLWRQLVGSRVLAVTTSTTPTSVNSTLAVHAWCAAVSAPAPSGAVVLPYINLGSDAVEIMLGGGLASTPRNEFVLTAPNGNMTADAVLLNGAPLGVDSTGRLSALPIVGRSIPPTGNAVITLPAHSYGYFVLTAANAPACVA